MKALVQSERLRRLFFFLLVGGVGFILDAAIYNVLTFYNGHGPLYSLPLVAKIIAIVVPSVVTYFGNNALTYRDRGVSMTLRRFLVYVAFSLLAMLLQLACLGFGRYVLHQHSQFSDNLWGTVVGQIAATAFRYLTWGRWVFRVSEERSSARALV